RHTRWPRDWSSDVCSSDLGGQRPWFTCPGCERRCGKLHFAPYLPRCRDCADLRYESQLENKLERGMRRARRIRRRLGGEPVNAGDRKSVVEGKSGGRGGGR